MMFRKIIIITVLLSMCSVNRACAFLDGTPEQIEQILHNAITSAGQGSTLAHSFLMDELDLYGTLDLNDRTKTEVMNYLQRLEKSGLFPSYVLERGNYNYTGGSNYLYITGINVPMYSLPIKQNSSIISRLNTDGTDYLVYLGEWQDRSGNSWVFAQDRNNDSRGWIDGKSVRLVNNNTFRKIITEIQRGLQEYNFAVLTGIRKEGREESKPVEISSEDIETIETTKDEDVQDTSGKKKEAYAAIAGASVVISLMITMLGLVKFVMNRILR